MGWRLEDVVEKQRQSPRHYPIPPSAERESLQPGDLVFFHSRGHVGIYLGGDRFIHAPHTGTVVRIDSMNGWYSSEYTGAVRVA